MLVTHDPQAVIERIEIPQRSSADELCGYYLAVSPV